jgi:hypothetical protein
MGTQHHFLTATNSAIRERLGADTPRHADIQLDIRQMVTPMHSGETSIRNLAAKLYRLGLSEHLSIISEHLYSVDMTQTNSASSKRTEALEALSEEDRVWLAERLVEYHELLEYLHAN